MIKIENNCYDCPRPCAGCGRNHMEVHICDDCRDAYAEYVVDGDDLCEDCLVKRVQKDLTQLSSDVAKRPDLNLWDVAYFLYDQVEEV